MKDVRATVDESANSLATWTTGVNEGKYMKRKLYTSAILRIFSFRSFSEKPRSLFSPKRTLSPSKRYAAMPRCKRCCSSAVAMVDFPEAERPVNQIVKPRCLRYELRSC